MTIFSTLKITSSGIGGAVAEAVLHDLRVNSLGLQGFPQVTVLRPDKENFEIVLQFDEHKESFTLSNNEAQSAVKKMKAKQGYDPDIFDRIQKALANLEGAAVNSN